MRSFYKLSSLIFVVLVLGFFTACQIGSDPIKYNVIVQAPAEASLVIMNNSIETQTVLANTQRTFSVTAGETLQISINYNNSENNYSVFKWNGATKVDELNASTVITRNTTISVDFMEQFTISFTAPLDSNVEIYKDASIIKTVSAGNTDIITDWVGTELSFSLISPPDNHELKIISGVAEKIDRLSGTLEILSDDEVVLSSSIMPYVTIVAPSNYSIAFRIEDQENIILSQGETNSVYIVSGSLLTLSVQDLDISNFEVTNWSGLVSTNSSEGTITIIENTAIEVVVSQIFRTLSITEPSINAYVKVYNSSDLSGLNFSGEFQEGVTRYLVPSGETIYLSPQVVVDSSFISWGSTVSDATESPLTLLMNSNQAFTPAYLSSVVEPGVVFVSPTGLTASEANGSKGLPFNNIQDAIDSISTGEVRVATGTYDIDSPIVMKPGVSVSGSYTIENHGALWIAPSFVPVSRGLGLNPTTNVKLNIIGAGTSANYLAVAKFSGDEFTNLTTVKDINFSYDSLSRSYVSGLLFEDGASPTIEHCSVISGEATQTSQGIRSINSSPKIRNSYITAGKASSSIGVYNSGSIEILSSEIDTAVAGSNTIGMYNDQATDVIVENSLISSQGLNSSGFYGYAYGLNNSSSTTTITNSTIMAKGGGPTSSFGVTLGTRAVYERNSTSTISGNTITTMQSSFGGSGVAYYASNSPSILLNNLVSITSGSSVAYGLYLSSSNAVIGGNIVNIGRVSYGGAAYGIFSSNSNPLVLNNTIESGHSGDVSESSYGIYLESGSGVISNNIIFSKPSVGPRYGLYSSGNLIKPKYLNNNAFFDLTSALYAPQGTTGVYFVTNPSEFTTARTGMDESKMVGNIGESVENDDSEWTTTAVFNGYSTGDYSLKSSVSDSVKQGGMNLTSSLIQTFIDEIDVAYSATNIEISDWISTDSAQKNRDPENWSMGALQY